MRAVRPMARRAAMVTTPSGLWQTPCGAQTTATTALASAALETAARAAVETELESATSALTGAEAMGAT